MSAADGYISVLWIPAFAGMTGAAGMTMLGLAGGDAYGRLAPRFRRNDGGLAGNDVIGRNAGC